MAKKNTGRVKVGKYTITKHAQNRIVDESRKINKIDILNNLFTKPNGATKIRRDNWGRPSYNRIGKRATTSQRIMLRPVDRSAGRTYANSI